MNTESSSSSMTQPDATRKRKPHIIKGKLQMKTTEIKIKDEDDRIRHSVTVSEPIRPQRVIQTRIYTIDDSAGNYLISIIEFIVHEACNDAGFSYRLVSEKDQLILRQSWRRCHFRRDLWLAFPTEEELSMEMEISEWDDEAEVSCNGNSGLWPSLFFLSLIWILLSFALLAKDLKCVPSCQRVGSDYSVHSHRFYSIYFD